MENKTTLDIMDIKNEVKPIIEKAWECPLGERKYFLEQLPMTEEYDEEVHHFILHLSIGINTKDKDYVEFYFNKLISHYIINHREYKEFSLE